MTEASMPAEPTNETPAKASRFVQRAPEPEDPDTRGKLSPAKGVMIAAGAATVFWAAVAAVVAAVRS